MLLKLFPLAFLASTALASGATIVAAIETITNDTLKLQSAVTGWDGGLLGVLPIVAISTQLLIDINAGTDTANASANLTIVELISIIGPTQALVTDVQTALASVIAVKDKFAKLFLAPVIKIDLELEKAATDDFSAAIISKVPALFQGLAASLTAPVDVAFDYAIGNYTGIL